MPILRWWETTCACGLHFPTRGGMKRHAKNCEAEKRAQERRAAEEAVNEVHRAAAINRLARGDKETR